MRCLSLKMVFVFSFFSLFGEICLAQNSSLVKNDNATQSNRQIDSLISLSEEYSITRPKKARAFALQALEIAEKTNEIEQQAICRLSIAKSYKTTRDFNSILQTLNPLLANLNEIDNYDIVAEILNSIGIAHYQLGHDTIPLSKYINDSKTNSNQSDIEDISLSLKAIGRFYQKIGNYEKSIEFLKKSVRIDSITCNTQQLGESTLLLAKAYVQVQKDSIASRLFRRSIFNLKMTERVDLAGDAYLSLAELTTASNPQWSQKFLDSALTLRVLVDSFRVNTLISLIHASARNPEKALTALEKTKIYISNDNHRYRFLEANLSVAKSFWQKRNFKKSEALYLETIDLSSSCKFYTIALKATTDLAQMYGEQGKTRDANKLLLQYISIRNSFENERLKYQGASPANSLERKLEAYQKEAKFQNVIIEKEEARRYFLLMLVAITLPLLLFISFLLVGRIRAGKVLAQRNKQIEQQNEELNAINEQLLLSQQKLQRLNSTKDKFFSIVAHDLKSPLVALKTSVFNMRQTMHAADDLHNGNLTTLEEALTNTINLLNNLLFWALSQEDSIAFQPERFNVSECLEIEVANAKLIASQKNIDLKINIPKSLQIETDSNMFLFIFRNLLSNALKFTPEQGEILVTTELKGSSFTVTISDTGKGMTAEDLISLFEINDEKLREKKRSKSGTGLGLLLSKEFATKMGGEIIVKSEEGVGSAFTLKIPNSKK